MAVYAYSATNAAGRRVNGTLVADTPRAARDRLRHQSMTVLEVGAVSATPRQTVGGRHRLRSAQLTSIIRELATLVGVGTPLVEALDLLARQYHGKVRSVVQLLREQVTAGQSLGAAMSETGAFDAVCTSLVAAGEAAGTIDVSLERYADLREKWSRARGRLGAVLLYPAMVMTLGVGVAVFLMTRVMPKLLDALIDAGRPLPPLTRAVKACSDAVCGYWWLLGAAVVAAALGGRAVMRARRARRIRDHLVLVLPLIGAILRKQEIARICEGMSYLLRSGIDFVQSLRITAGATGNVLMRAALERCADGVSAGRDIDVALDAARFFPPSIVHVFAIGQQSGRLEDVLARVASDLDYQVQASARRLAVVLEPITILILAGFIGVIAFATMLPILEAGDAF